ncbi:MAG: hypothetical protein VCE12_19870, partial [Candidatus Latescibacterota bacterium]
MTQLPSVKTDTVPRGLISNLLSLMTMALGLLWTLVRDNPDSAMPSYALTVGPWLLAAGVFGFAGGITNWLAVKMLFD